jgi:hypothetical protein
VVLALIALALLIPDLDPSPATYRWVLGAYVALACGLVAAIVMGQRRSRLLRVAGWLGLLAFVVLELSL